MLCISDDPLCTMKVIQGKNKLKGDKIEEPEMYLGADLSNMTNADGQECWTMHSEKYCTSAVTNVKSIIGKVWFKVAVKLSYQSKL